MDAKAIGGVAGAVDAATAFPQHPLDVATLHRVERLTGLRRGDRDRLLPRLGAR
jgi:hypothetical protein